MVGGQLMGAPAAQSSEAWRCCLACQKLAYLVFSLPSSC